MNEHTAQQSIYSFRGVQSKWRQWLPLSPSLRVTLTPEEAEGPQVMPAPGGPGCVGGSTGRGVWATQLLWAVDSELPGENGQRGQDQTLRESPACDPKVVLGLLACSKPLPRDPCCWFRERCHHSMPLESGGPGSSALQVSVSSSVTGRHHRPQPSLSVGEPCVRAGASPA